MPTGEGLRADPQVPDRMLPLRLVDVSCCGRSHSLEVTADGWHVETAEG
jgi:hypothetical protein